MRRITTTDQDLLLEVSPCTTDEVDTFTSSDCWKLARELHLRGTGRLIAAVESRDTDWWCHMAVELEDGQILDANGLQTRKQFLARWRPFLIQSEATVAFYDPTDEDYWNELVGDQGIGLSDDDEVAEIADKLIEWVEDL